jgi:hypothetical protein
MLVDRHLSEFNDWQQSLALLLRRWVRFTQQFRAIDDTTASTSGGAYLLVPATAGDECDR